MDDLESLAKELKLSAARDLDFDDDEDLDQLPPPRSNKGGKRKKKQTPVKVNHKKGGGGGGGGSVTLCQLMNICDSLPLGKVTPTSGQDFVRSPQVR